MSRSVVVERHIQLADFYELQFEDQTLPEVVEQAGWVLFLQRTGYTSKNMVREFYAAILWAVNLDELSREPTVCNVQVTFLPNELTRFFDYERNLAAFPNLSLHDKGKSIMAKPTHQMLSDITARLTALESKVGQLDFDWKKEVAAIRLALKDVASGAQLHALNERVVLIEEHMRRVCDVLQLTDEEQQ
ncbi:hypothetical protein CJ030_MR1G015961 [Morella rubra]|uniref:Uncharacterized protein n=1 Tax=Morella rubra TaxID=262757 RepID=A0A6A1WMC2_9ROSI|nr:hypothetical protein CJ030_MR1G015961 [Morella rubra]